MIGFTGGATTGHRRSKLLTDNTQLTDSLRSVFMRLDSILDALWDKRFVDIQDLANDAKEVMEDCLEFAQRSN